MGILGYNTIGDADKVVANEYAYANPYTMPSDSGNSVVSFSIYGLCSSATGIELRLGLFSNDSNLPGDLLDYTGLFTPTNTSNQWITEDATLNYVLVADTIYFIALLDTGTDAGTTWTAKYNVNGVNRPHIKMGNVTQFNDPWSGTLSGADDQQWAMYLTYESNTKTKTFNSDSHIWGTETGTFDSDSNVYVPETGTFNSDSHIFNEVEETVTFNSDSYVYNIITKTFNSDSYIQGTETGTFNSDSYVYNTITETFNSDSHIQDTVTGTFNSDAYIWNENIGIFNSDSHIQGTETGTFNSDAHIWNENTGTFVSDTWIYSADTESVIVTSNAIIINPTVFSYEEPTAPLASTVPASATVSVPAKFNAFDMQLKHVCDHSLTSGQFVLSTCPRCLGTGYYYDIKYNEAGKLLEVRSVDKLTQTLEKFVLTENNDFHSEVAINIQQWLGNSPISEIKAIIKFELSKSIIALMNAQRGVSTLSNDARIASLDNIEIFEGTDNLGTLDYAVTITTIAGNTRELTGTFTTLKQ